MSFWDEVPDQWKPSLSAVRDDIEAIGQQLEHQARTEQMIAPEMNRVFRALSIHPANVRVIIVGQDPYPTAGHATGLAFSVPPGTTPLPPTLRNILREVIDDVGASHCVSGDMSHWHNQGVMLLNRVLTIVVGKPASHQGLGWERITTQIIQTVCAINPDTVGVLWGKSASGVAEHFAPELLVESVHPSPLSAYRGFFGSKPFSRVNSLLQSRGQPPISW